MAKGISVHIGLNRVDPGHYDGWVGTLAACEADAKDMRALARSRKFKPTLLLTEAATADAVTTAIRAAAVALKKGDFFFLTYSGHGSQVDDTNGDDRDGKDETWVCYDRELVDDELYELWGNFRAGVRILVLSDSCHSGSVTRVMLRERRAIPAGRRVRLMPPDIAKNVEKKNAALYRKIQKDHPSAEKTKVAASVLLISGCMDNQLSEDGDRNGLFTGTLKKVLAAGKVKQGYRKFRDVIVSMMPDYQTPNYFRTGALNPKFEAGKLFTI